ncbi:MAG: hypothetical protein HYR51_13655 [Candidatus Rokubacteria bacterium]|nr:hypothetical protein [Candidatus Rokubacteria bacterium]
MKRLVAGVTIAVVVGGLAAVAMAQSGWGPMMGGGPGGGRFAAMQGRMGGGYGPGAGCPGFAGDAAASAVNEEQATALANEYTAKHFKGYTVERVLPFQGRLHTAYQVELKGPSGETRTLHVTPWGGVRPFAAVR